MPFDPSTPNDEELTLGWVYRELIAFKHMRLERDKEQRRVNLAILLFLLGLFGSVITAVIQRSFAEGEGSQFLKSVATALVETKEEISDVKDAVNSTDRRLVTVETILRHQNQWIADRENEDQR